MLSLRFIIVMSLSAVALWGLFSLLENLREPALLRSAKAVVVKGCDPMESDDAARLCPQLFCQKALLDARVFPLQSRFEVTVDQQAAGQHLIGGGAGKDASAPSARFACLIENAKVVAARAVEEAELAALANQQADWSLDPASP